jgi:hypothetical protein
MADYYPLILEAVSRLGPDATGERRRAMYDRARAALITQLRAEDPPLKESQITRERLELEEAVRKVEQVAAQLARTRSRSVPNLNSDADDLGRSAAEASRSATRMDTAIRNAVVDSIKTARMANPFVVHGEIRDKILWTVGEEPSATNSVQRRPVAPPVTIIPEQNLKQAIGFSPTRRGPLDLVLDPPRDPFDPEQTMLYQRIRLQLKQLKDTIPSQERTQIDPAIDEFLDQPETWHEVEFKKILWLCGNSIRTLLTQHDAVKSDAEPHYSKLPPSVAEALRRPVQAWNIFVQSDQDLALLDAQRLGPREQVEILKHLAAAAEFIAKAANDRNITTERAASALTSTLKAANDSNSNINTRLAQELADKTTKNFFSQLLRRAYLIRDAIVDPDSEAAKTLTLEFVKGASSAAGGVALLYLGSHAISFFEFVAMNPVLVKQYILVTFENLQMTEIVDAIEFEYRRLKILGGSDHKV